MSEHGPISSSGNSIHSYHTPGEGPTSAYSPYPYGNPAQPSYPPGHGAPSQSSYGFDDDGIDEVYEPSESGRSTPASRRGPATRSLPAEQRHDASSSSSSSRPRAQTEDSNSHLINQWRSQGQTPGQNGAPNLPGQPARGMSQHSSTGSDAHSLRSSASSNRLRTKQSTEFGGGGMTASPAMSYSRLPGDQEEMTPRARGREGDGAAVYRQASHGQVPTGGAPPMLRNRSASSPNIYGPGSASQNGRFVDSPQLPDQPYSNDYNSSNGHAHGHPPYGSSIGGGKSLSRTVGITNSGGTISSVSTGHKKRFSSSSVATDRSSATSAHSGSALPYSSSTSPASSAPFSAGLPHPPLPAMPSRSPVPPPASANAVRVKTHFGDDTFVVVVLDSVPYVDLVEKVLKKIRMCGGDKAKIESQQLRLRYRDEDGDRILITSEEDIGLAFETARTIMAQKGAGAGLELVLDASVDPQ